MEKEPATRPASSKSKTMGTVQEEDDGATSSSSLSSSSSSMLAAASNRQLAEKELEEFRAKRLLMQKESAMKSMKSKIVHNEPNDYGGTTSSGAAGSAAAAAASSSSTTIAGGGASGTLLATEKELEELHAKRALLLRESKLKTLKSKMLGEDTYGTLGASNVNASVDNNSTSNNRINNNVDTTSAGETAVSTSGVAPELAQFIGMVKAKENELVDDDFDVESSKHLEAAEQIRVLLGKLSRRNLIIELLRKAYYHDVILVKDEIRSRDCKRVPLSSASTFAATPKAEETPLTSSRLEVSTARSAIAGTDTPSITSRQAPPPSSRSSVNANTDEPLSSIPSIDLREVLPLFAPAETFLKVHPCETCGGTLELVHGENKELASARHECARAQKSEQQTRATVHRLRSELGEMKEVKEALDQRVRALTKENAYTLEQLQASRKTEREQKVTIANLKSKLQLLSNAQEELEKKSRELNDVRQQLSQVSHERDTLSLTNSRLKEELAETSKNLHQTRIDKAQVDAQFAETSIKLEEELKKTAGLTVELQTTTRDLEVKNILLAAAQGSTSSLRDELSSTLQRFEQTKRHLEDQLVEEERTREEMQEKLVDYRKQNKRLTREVEGMQKVMADSKSTSASEAQKMLSSQLSAMSKLEEEHELIKHQLDRLTMRENDLVGLIVRMTESSRRREKTVQRQQTNSRSSPRRFPLTSANSGSFPDAAKADMSSSPHSSRVSTPGPIAAGLDAGPAAIPITETTNESSDTSNDFEIYHQEMFRVIKELEIQKDKNTKQAKTITDMEKKQQVLQEQLDEAKMTIDSLNGNLNALKQRLSQDNAGAAEQLEEMNRRVEETKHELQLEQQKVVALMGFVQQVSGSIHEASQNPSMVVDIDYEKPNIDEEAPISGDPTLAPEMIARKRELRKRIALEKSFKKFEQSCRNRAEMIHLEVAKITHQTSNLGVDLEEANHQIEVQLEEKKTYEAELQKLRLTEAMNKNALMRLEKSLKETSDELRELQQKHAWQTKENERLTTEYDTVVEDQKRLTMLVFDKTKAWEQEISNNDRCMHKIAQLQDNLTELSKVRDELRRQLQDIADREAYRRQTNQDVEVMACPEVEEGSTQTDRWRPDGLILRQRNDIDKVPQRYLGKVSMLAAFPDAIEDERTEIQMERAAEIMQHAVELNMYPHARANLPHQMRPTRGVKATTTATRVRALSKLYLSSDGISKKYAMDSPQEVMNPESVMPTIIDDKHPPLITKKSQ